MQKKLDCTFSSRRDGVFVFVIGLVFVFVFVFGLLLFRRDGEQIKKCFLWENKYPHKYPECSERTATK